MGCAGAAVVPTVNVSDELKSIVFADDTRTVQGEVISLSLGMDTENGAYVSVISIIGNAVRVDYLTLLPGCVIMGYLQDDDGDGVVDVWAQVINNAPSNITPEEAQEYYKKYLEFARYVSENGVVDDGTKV